jgi:hypothetical protein
MVGHTPSTLQHLFSKIGRQDCVLEVAPFFDPVLAKSDYNVYYTDYVDTDALRGKADQNPTGRNAVVPPIDFVWVPGRPLRACVPPGLTFDFVVASHVMEHVPNPVGWLNDLLSVTRVGGQVGVFLPDRRNPLDVFRNQTSFADVVAWWAGQPAIPTLEQITDFLGSGSRPPSDEPQRWVRSRAMNLERRNTDQNVINFAELIAREPRYLDVHCSVWESASFVDIFRRVVQFGMLNVEVSDPIDDVYEFFVTFTKLGEPSRPPPVRAVR